jgi:ATPase subunit of ABC transporter with duplicated ATPase domains
VGADERSALVTVLAADEVRTGLMEEREMLEKEQERGKDVTQRLAEVLYTQNTRNTQNTHFLQVYEELQAIGADQAEPKARRLLAGLGFDKAMQVSDVGIC